MQAEIIPKLFIKNLKAIPSKKPVNHPKKLKKISLGAEYLYRAVILPKMQGKEVYTGRVNMDAFELEDIETVCDYYNEKVAAERSENEALRSLYTKIKSSPALNSHTDFI